MVTGRLQTSKEGRSNGSRFVCQESSTVQEEDQYSWSKDSPARTEYSDARIRLPGRAVQNPGDRIPH
jgi:hypothetical protein